MNRELDHLLTEIAVKLRGQDRVPESAPRLIEGVRDGLDDEDHTPEHRRTMSWKDGRILGRKFREALDNG